jgi:uncharacterized protein (UPF0276 family)
MAGNGTESEFGVGLVWVPGVEPLLAPGTGLVDIIEIEPQMWWDYRAGEARPYAMREEAFAFLEGCGKPVIAHGVGGGAAGTVLPPAGFTGCFHEVCARLKPAWISEHLSFLHQRENGERYFAGMMLPPLQTPAGVETAVANVGKVSRGLPAPFALETQVNYLRSACGTLSDGEFMARVAEGLDCGILLDLTNLWVNQMNGRQPVEEYLDAIPLDRVIEVHLAGARLDDGVWLDAHNGTLQDEVLALAERVLPRLPKAKALTLEVVPYFVPRAGMDLLARQLQVLRGLWEGRHGARRAPGAEEAVPRAVDASRPRPRADLIPLRAAETITPAAWEKALGLWTALEREDGPVFAELRGDRGLATYRMIANSFRWGNLTDLMGLAMHFLLSLKGAAWVEEMLADYCRWCVPGQFPIQETVTFAAYMRAHPVDHPYWRNVLDFEEAKLIALRSGLPLEIPFAYEPRALLESVARGEIPVGLAEGEFVVEVAP